MKSHKTLHAWQHANNTVKAVVVLSSTSWKPQLGAIFGQLQRASLSVQLNISEGYAFGPSKRMNHHLQIAYGSAIETGDLLELLLDIGMSDTQSVSAARESCTRSQQAIMGLLRRYKAQNRALQSRRET